MSDYTIDKESFHSEHLEVLERLHDTPKVMRWIDERIDKEIRGAYRAGYEYVYIGEPSQPLTYDETEMNISVSYSAMPTYTQLSGSVLPTDRVWHEYDLTDLSPEEYREHTRKG